MKTKQTKLSWSVVLTVALTLGLGMTIFTKAQAASEAVVDVSTTSYLGAQLASEFRKIQIARR